jgi:alpha-mannosidase
MDRFRVKGVDYVNPGALKPLVMKDNQDPWGMTVKSFRRPAGRFRLLPRREGSLRSGVEGTVIPSVRVIEDGPVRSVVEAVLAYGHSCIHQQYKLPKAGTEVEVEVRVLWNEKDRMLKLSIPTKMTGAGFFGQVAYGRAKLENDGSEMVAQKWVAAVSRSENKALTCINDGIYGSDMRDGELRLSLLRSPAYSGHPIQGRLCLDQDRHIPRIDQGERIFRFWLNAGKAAARLNAIDREALAKNERPFALSFFPPCRGRRPKPSVLLSDRAVQVAALKPSEQGGDCIIRLFEPTGRKRTIEMTLPFLPARKKVSLAPYEVKTFRLDPKTRRCIETNLLEEPVRRGASH